ncbi:MAG: 3-oxoacyl-ACP reductase FabG [Chloroflexota bacterium]|nr:3-oxoacyl-ACP reductase FabG [Chloroflexota bacterium]
MAVELSLNDKVAIVSGAGGELGRGIARKLSEAGAAVVIAEVEADKGAAAAEEVQQNGGQAIAVQCDISDKASVETMVSRAVESFGGVDILVNNAAIFPSRPWTEVSEEEWDRVLGVNLKGYFLCARAVYPSMKERGWGRIVNISSVTFFLGRWANLIHYVSSKGGVVGLTKALARELGEENITVNAVAPGAIPTPAEAIHPDPEGYNAWVLENQALKRRGTPEDIANAVLFFASPLSAFVTGQTLLVDGGWVMR